MDFNIINFLPQAVIVAAVLVVCFVKTTSEILVKIEEQLEAKKGKQIKFFDHKKIWLSFIWCTLAVVILAISGFIAWKECLYYLFVIMGISTFFYETIIKNLGLK